MGPRIYLSIHLLKDSDTLVTSMFVTINKTCYKHSCAEFCVVVDLVSTNLGKCQGMWLLDHMVTLYFPNYSAWLCYFTFHQQWIRVLAVLHPLYEVFSVVLDSSHSSRCVWNLVVSTYSSLMAYDIGHFYVLICCLYIFLEGGVYSDLLPIFKFFVVVWVVRVLCLFWMPVLYQKYYLQIFSSVCDLSLTEWNFYHNYQLYFSWIILCFYIKKTSFIQAQYYLNLAILYSRGVIVLHLVQWFIWDNL